MNPLLGWTLAAVAVLAGWKLYGWPGVLMAVSVTTFWLLLQFSRALRAMKLAGQAPVGRVPSAVMLNAKLQVGMTMLKVIGLTRSLGRQQGSDDVWVWEDEGASRMTLTFQAGKLQRWVLERPAEAAAEGADAGGAAP